MKVIGWVIYYGDGRVISSKKSTPKNLPDDDVQIRMLYFDEICKSNGYHNTEIQNGSDYYFFAPSQHGVIYGASNDTIEEIMRRYPGAIVTRGKWMEHEANELLVRAAYEDKHNHIYF